MTRPDLPFLSHLRSERPSADLVAGLTVGVMLVPQGMAYAMLAGVPPVHGLYAALAPVVIYALLGTSRQLSVGPVAMDSLLVAAGVAPLAGGDGERYLALAISLSLVVGVIQLILGTLRAGFLVHLLSRPVLTGFTAAAAIVIATSQLGSLLGVPLGRGRVHEVLASAAGSWSSVHSLTVVIGAAALAVGFALRRWAPRIPAAMVLVVVGGFASALAGFEATGVSVVGPVPSGLPAPRLVLPDLVDLSALLPVALAIALVGFMESIAVAKVYATRHGYEVDPDRELKALGAANLAGSLFQAFPVTGGFSRTAVNDQAGARTQRSALVAAAVVAVTLLFLTGLFHALPHAILAAIIVTAVVGLVDVRGMVRLWRIDRRDFALMALTGLATLVLGIQQGILVGAGLSIAVVLEQIVRPHVAVLGRMPDSRIYRDIARNPEAVVDPDIAVLRMDASLFYGNAEAFKEAARAALDPDPHGGRAPSCLVIDAYAINRVDSTGLDALLALLDELRASSKSLRLACVKGLLRDRLASGGFLADLGEDRVHAQVWEAVEAAQREIPTLENPGTTAPA